MVVIDTNIIIDHLRQKEAPDSVLSRLFHQIEPFEGAITTLTIQELFAGQSTKEKGVQEWILGIINPYRILPYTFEVAKLAGEIERELARPIDTVDAAIAATAIINGLKLATLNQKDFAGIENLQLMDF